MIAALGRTIAALGPMIGRIFLLLMLAAVLFAGLVGRDAYRFITRPLPLQKPILVTIPEGVGLRRAVAHLAARGVFDAPRQQPYFIAYTSLRGDSGKIKSGEYRIAPGLTPRQLLTMLVAGHIHQHRFTVVAGWRFAQLRAALAADDVIKHTLKGKSDTQVMAALGHPNESAEGRFLPDTYFFPRATTDVAFLKRAYNAMHKALAAQWAKRESNLPLDNPYQALALASIIEKETAVPGERARIAGVFVRRLKQGMPLQTDPTVIYGIHDFDGDLRRRDLTRDGPYNTYTRHGLPPTPIALPSRASIHAAMHPAQGKALFFVARGDGTHQFSDTYSEQEQAVRKYQLHK